MSLNYKLENRNSDEISRKLERGVNIRASHILFVLAVLFTLYGFLSTGIIAKYDSTVTIWSNFWPRLVFNGIPFLVLGIYLRRPIHGEKTKSYLWAVLQPIVFVAACCIYVWPIMLLGNVDIYKYFHAANMFVITFGLIYVAPSRPVMLVQIACYSVLFLIPLLYLTRNDSSMSAMITNDYFSMVFGACVAGHLTHNLRRRIAQMDAHIKSTLTPLVGNRIVSAIYEDNFETLNNKQAYGVILSMDLRGYTQFMHNNPKDICSAFMRDYHFMVSTIVGKSRGFIHKTAGDSHLISFGLMDESNDLSDISALKFEVVEAEQNKSKTLAEHAEKMFGELVETYETLKARYDIVDNLRIGAAIAGGTIELQIQGNQDYRQEVNIEGDTIVRSARLEAYTKLLMKFVGPEDSMMIISPEIIDELRCDIQAEMWNISSQDLLIRDYPNLKKIYYKTWRPVASSIKKIAS